MTDEPRLSALKEAQDGLQTVGCIQDIPADLAGADISGIRQLQATSVDWLAGRVGEAVEVIDAALHQTRPGRATV